MIKLTNLIVSKSLWAQHGTRLYTFSYQMANVFAELLNVGWAV